MSQWLLDQKYALLFLILLFTFFKLKLISSTHGPRGLECHNTSELNHDFSIISSRMHRTLVMTSYNMFIMNTKLHYGFYSSVTLNITAFTLLLPWTLWCMFYGQPEYYSACSMLGLNLMAHVICSVWTLWRMFYAQFESYGACSMLSLNIKAHVLCSVWTLWRMFYAQCESYGACSMLSLKIMAHVLWPVWILWLMFYAESESYGACSMLSLNLMAHVLCSVWILWRMFMASLNIMAHVLCSVWILWRMFYGQSEYHGACFMVEEEDGGGIGSRTTKLGLWCGGYNAKDRGWGLNGKNRWGERTESWFFHYIFQNAQNTGHDIL